VPPRVRKSRPVKGVSANPVQTQSKSRKKGMDDWRSAEDYQKYVNLTKEQCAWEFLRRNPVYIRTWEQCYQASIRHNRAKPKLSETGVWAYRWHLKRLYDPKSSCFDIKPIWQIDLDDVVKEVSGRPDELRELFPQAVSFEVDSAEVIGEGRPNKKQRLSGQQRSPYIVIALDLRHDMILQMKTAKALFEKRRKNFIQRGEVLKGFNNLIKERLPIYLRLLDAKNSGAKNSQIAKNISDVYNLERDGTEGVLSKINKHIKKAEDISHNYYRFLFSTDS
jgi:hypothetical protein